MQTRDLVQPRIGIIILRKITHYHLISDTKSVARNFPEVRKGFQINPQPVSQILFLWVILLYQYGEISNPFGLRNVFFKRELMDREGILGRWPGHVNFIKATFRGRN